MARILRGDIFWADLTPTRGHEQGGRRPVLVLSRGTFNERSGTVIAVAITSQQPRVEFPFGHGNPRREVAQAIMGQDRSDSHAVNPAARQETWAHFFR